MFSINDIFHYLITIYSYSFFFLIISNFIFIFQNLISNSDFLRPCFRFFSKIESLGRKLLFILFTTTVAIPNKVFINNNISQKDISYISFYIYIFGLYYLPSIDDTHMLFFIFLLTFLPPSIYYQKSFIKNLYAYIIFNKDFCFTEKYFAFFFFGNQNSFLNILKGILYGILPIFIYVTDSYDMEKLMKLSEDSIFCETIFTSSVDEIIALFTKDLETTFDDGQASSITTITSSLRIILTIFI